MHTLLVKEAECSGGGTEGYQGMASLISVIAH